MGNQNTSGIAEDEKAAPERSQGDQVEEENQVGAEEISDFQDSEAAQKEISEEHKRPVNEESETQKATLPNFTNNHVEPKESSFDVDIASELSNEVHDQLCTLKGEKQTSEAESEPKSTTAIDITSEPQEDQSTLANEIIETLQVDTKENDHHGNLSTISLQNLRAEENEKQNECSSLAEEKQTTNELGNWEETSCAEQTQPVDQEIDQFETIDQSDDMLIGENNKAEINENDFKSDTSDVLVHTEHSHPMAENDQEDDTSSSGENIHETSHDMEKYISSSEFSTGIVQGTETELNSNDEKPTILEDIEKLNIESLSSYKGGQVELKKSTSFDFGLPFDSRLGESDQTPLLYNTTATRSFSSCSAMRFQNRSVQTEHYEAVEVEEKTIRMERSNSESSSRANLPPNLQNKRENAVVVTKAKEESGSPSRENCDMISPNENVKRKPRSTFFTTCICCTAAIN